MPDWRKIIADYLQLPENLSKLDGRIDILISEVKDNTQRILLLEQKEKTFSAQTEAICHNIFDQKVATYRNSPLDNRRRLKP